MNKLSKIVILSLRATKHSVGSVAIQKNNIVCFCFGLLRHFIPRNDSKRIGFTLAEVLVTLAIIGVVAALTIPSLIQSTQKQQYVTGLKKAYSDLSQATLQLMDNNGGTMTGLMDLGNMHTRYCGYLNCIKKCDYNTVDGNCFENTGQTHHTGAILSNGMHISFYNFDINCNDNYLGNGQTVCGIIYVDVNGWKYPNTLGRDIFEFWIARDGIFHQEVRIHLIGQASVD